MRCTPDVDQLVRTGHFAEALRELREVRMRPESHPLERAVLLAEVLLQTGPIEEAVNLANRLLRNEGITASFASRCLYVLGRAAYWRGQPIESHQRLVEAGRLAQQAGDMRQRCAARLAILATASDDWPAEAVAVFCQELRREVVQLGDPIRLMQLHIDMARLEARRGRIDAALRHLLAAKGLVPVESDLLTHVTLLLVQSAVNIIASHYSRSVDLCRSALALAEHCGASFLIGNAKANLGQILLQLGELSQAQTWLTAALREMREMTMWRHAVVDSLALVRIAAGEWHEAEALLKEADGLLAPETRQIASWSRVASLQTHARLWMRRSQWDRASSAASAGIRLAEQRGDTLYTSLHRLSLAEAKLKSGQRADDELAALFEGADDNVPKLRAELERIKALAVSASGGPARQAARHLERKLTIKNSISDIYTRVDAVEDFVRLLAESPEFSGLGAGPEILNLEQLPRLPEHVLLRSDAATSLASGVELGHATALDRLAALLGLAGRADAFARECVDLVIEAECSHGVALVGRSGRSDSRVLVSHGWDLATSRKKASKPGSSNVMALGEWRGSAYQLIVEPKDDIVSLITLASIRKIVDAALQLERYRREEKERSALWPVEDLTNDSDAVFVSSEMLDIVNTAKRVAPTTLPVLLTGETGTGKEILARIIHKASPRADKVFSAFNCTAVPRDMIDSQLFGYRRGAFTGAQDGFAGVIRGAAGGTLFLDEIGEIGLDLQPKLLRFLETGEIHPLGEAHPVKVDVRIIAATNANLDRMVGDGRFREDLLYRLNVIRFQIPPLRERREEIPQLVQHFLRRYADEFKKGRPRATEETMEYLLLYAWPGNVRHLANELRRIVALIEPDGEITSAHLSTEIRSSRRTVPAGERRANDEVVVRMDQPLATVLDSIERLMVGRALEQSDGKVEDAAQRLGISRKGLFLKRKRWGTQPERGE